MYVLFYTETTKFVRIMRNGYWQNAKFETLAAAKAGLTRLAKKGKVNPADCSILSMEEFAKIEKTEVVRNLMTGKEVVQSVNTPLCCDVSSETHWSM